MDLLGQVVSSARQSAWLTIPGVEYRLRAVKTWRPGRRGNAAPQVHLGLTGEGVNDGTSTIEFVVSALAGHYSAGNLARNVRAIIRFWSHPTCVGLSRPASVARRMLIG
jgi:hypothetical protein